MFNLKCFIVHRRDLRGQSYAGKRKPASVWPAVEIIVAECKKAGEFQCNIIGRNKKLNNYFADNSSFIIFAERTKTQNRE